MLDLARSRLIGQPLAQELGAVARQLDVRGRRELLAEPPALRGADAAAWVGPLRRWRRVGRPGLQMKRHAEPTTPPPQTTTSWLVVDASGDR